jgi:hypothetical protein
VVVTVIRITVGSGRVLAPPPIRLLSSSDALQEVVATTMHGLALGGRLDYRVEGVYGVQAEDFRQGETTA